mmetsp:Transcript_27639/g.46379  ORF Transcript_27639/g.46379 Transcript_27639/m.46379 type:complete len:246 (-) Transcript_27639:714-1451(-)
MLIGAVAYRIKQCSAFRYRLRESVVQLSMPLCMMSRISRRFSETNSRNFESSDTSQPSLSSSSMLADTGTAFPAAESAEIATCFIATSASSILLLILLLLLPIGTSTSPPPSSSCCCRDGRVGSRASCQCCTAKTNCARAASATSSTPSPCSKNRSTTNSKSSGSSAALSRAVLSWMRCLRVRAHTRASSQRTEAVRSVAVRRYMLRMGSRSNFWYSSRPRLFSPRPIACKVTVRVLECWCPELV